MMDKEEYEKELVRMWDMQRGDEYKGKNICDGVLCEDCPLSEINNDGRDGCMEPMKVFEIIKIVDEWSKENLSKKYKLSRLEYEFLELLENEGYKYIVRSQINNLIAYKKAPTKLSNSWEITSGYKIISLFNTLFQFVQWKDKEPTSIQDVLENCEVIEDDD